MPLFWFTLGLIFGSGFMLSMTFLAARRLFRDAQEQRMRANFFYDQYVHVVRGLDAHEQNTGPA